MAGLDRQFRGIVGGGGAVVGPSRRARDCCERRVAYAETEVCPGPVGAQRARISEPEPAGREVGSGVPIENCGLLVSRAACLPLLSVAILISIPVPEIHRQASEKSYRE